MFLLILQEPSVRLYEMLCYFWNNVKLLFFAQLINQNPPDWSQQVSLAGNRIFPRPKFKLNSEAYCIAQVVFVIYCYSFYCALYVDLPYTEYQPELGGPIPLY